MPKMDFIKLKEDLGLVSWDDFYFAFLNQLSRRSNSSVRRQAAIIVRNNSIISMGCFDAYQTDDRDKVIGSGAIENAIAYCANSGISTNGATLYTYSFPGDIVCKILIKAGISEIKCVQPARNDSLGKVICEQANIKIMSLRKNI